MINRTIDAALNNRFLVIVLTCVLIAVGVWSMSVLPMGAVPDITPVQVQVLTNAPGLSPVEVEQFVTFPVEAAMSGIPGVEQIRSVTRFGLSAVTVYFKEGFDIYLARQLVMERLSQAQANIPEGFGEPEMGPISTGLGEIIQFEVVNDDDSSTPEYNLMELRSILDWDIAFKLRSVPGVVEVNTWGGELKTYEVAIDPNKLLNYDISITRLLEALWRNNANAGGGYIVHYGEQRIIRGEGLIGGGRDNPEQGLEDIRNIVLDSREDGTPIYVRDIGEVRFAPMIRQGAVTADGQGETVIGIVYMLWGENDLAVAQRVKEALLGPDGKADGTGGIEATLPPGVTIKLFYDRTDLIWRTIRTVVTNLVEGGLLVILVLFLLLGSFRGGLIVALAIPISMLGAFIGMLYAGYAGNLMSLGAIDFGLIVDGSVVMIENLVRRVVEYQKQHSKQKAPLSLIREACKQVGRPVVFGVGIIIVVYLPILTLRGIEGKMFRPMAFTVIFALCTSLILALTLMPVLGSLALRYHVSEKETLLIRWAKRIYEPLLLRVMRHPLLTFSMAATIFGISAWIATGMGATFIPELDEGDIALQAWRLPSVALEQSVQSTTQLERVLTQFPEVVTVVSKTGRAELATDPMGVEISDVYAIMTPQEQISPLEWPLAWVGLIHWPEDQWPSNNNPENIYQVLRKVHGTMTRENPISEDGEQQLRCRAQQIYAAFEENQLYFEKDQLIYVMDQMLRDYVPANTFSYTQPVELRFQELIAGVRSDIGVSLYGPDLDLLKQYGDRIAAVVRQVRGAADVRAQEIAGLPNVRVKIDRSAIARYGINAGDVLDAVRSIGGFQVGQVLEGQPRFFLQVRFAPQWRENVYALKHIKIADPLGRQIPLEQLVNIQVEPGPALVTREAISRRQLIEANVRGRDLASFVAEARQAVEEQVDLPPGYSIAWGGQFEQLQEATERLMIAVPVALFLIFALLYVTFNSWRPALLIYLNVPMAATGGIFALWLRGMPFSISAAVGFIALFGVAVLNGLVLVEYILELRREGKSNREAAFEAALLRMRPVLMTALVASLGFIPMATSTSAGAEVQRPLATVVIGGLITSTLLTLLVLPSIYRWFEPRQESLDGSGRGTDKVDNAN